MITDISQIAAIHAHTAEITKIVYSPTGDYIASTGKDETLKLIALHDDCKMHTLCDEEYVAIAWRPDGQALAATQGGMVTMYFLDGSDMQFLNPGDPLLSTIRQPAGGLAFDSSGTGLLCSCGTLILWNTTTGEVVSWFTDNLSHRDVAVGGSTFASVLDNCVRVYFPSENPLQTRDFQENDKVRRVVYYPGYFVIATCGGDTIRFWEVDRGIELVEGGLHHPGVTDIAFHPTIELFASADQGSNHHVYLWLPFQASCLATLEHPAGVTSIAFSLDGSLLACACDDGYIRVWNIVHLVQELVGGTQQADQPHSEPSLVQRAIDAFESWKEEIANHPYSDERAMFLDRAQRVHDFLAVVVQGGPIQFLIEGETALAKELLSHLQEKPGMFKRLFGRDGVQRDAYEHCLAALEIITATSLMRSAEQAGDLVNKAWFLRIAYSCYADVIAKLTLLPQDWQQECEVLAEHCIKHCHHTQDQMTSDQGKEFGQLMAG